MKEPIFETLFGSTVRIRVLRRFLNNPDEPQDKSSLSQFLKINKSAAAKELKNLKKISLIARTGRKFFLDKNFPLLFNLKNFILRPAPDFYDFLEKDFKSLRGIKLLLAAGFFQGEDEGIVDFLIVADKPKAAQIQKKICYLENQFGREIKYTLLSSSEFNYRYSMFDKFLRSILEGPHKVVINKLKEFGWL